MRLSKIKLAGFKSFVDPTTILLPSNLVGIVGPNGCGKSNVIDAVRWVMGESSAKSLRGESMADVIFNGSSVRKPVTQASVELVFDNGDGSLGGQYAEYAEISIKRHVSRDGQSNYFLNSTRCRRKDITDIFLGTGLGPHSYAIIEQNMISRLIEAKPDELRVFLEEAAGISKYKERRRETENRMKHTRENLDLFNIKRDELDKQLERLQRQANVAAKYKLLKQQERQLKAELLALRWQSLINEADAQEKFIREQEIALEVKIAEQRRIEAALEKQRAQQVDANQIFSTVQERFYSVRAEIERSKDALNNAQERRRQQQQDLEQVEAAWNEMQVHLKDDNQQIAELAGQLEQAEPELNEAQQAEQLSGSTLAQAEQVVHIWQADWETFNQRATQPVQTAQIQRARMQHLEEQLHQFELRSARLLDEQKTLVPAPLAHEIDTLSEQQAAHEHEGVQLEEKLQNLLKQIAELRQRNQNASTQRDAKHSELESQRGRLASLEALQQSALGKRAGALTSWLKDQGLEHAPRLAQQLQVDKGWERAVECVLGFHLEAVCVDGLSGIAARLDSLQSALSLFDTSAQSAPSINRNMAMRLQDKVHSAWPLDGLFAGIYIADTLEQALSLTRELAAHESIITPQGIWLGNGWLRVRHEADEHLGVLGRETELKELSTNIQRLNDALTDFQGELEGGREQLHAHEVQRETLQTALTQAQRQYGQTQAQLSAKQMRHAQMRERAQVIRAELDEIADLMNQAQRDQSMARTLLHEALAENEALERQRADLIEQRDEHRVTVEHLRGASRQTHDTTHQIALRVESVRTNLAATRQRLERVQNQYGQLATRREQLSVNVAESEAPIQALQAEREQQLARHLLVESELGQARGKVEELEHSLRQLDHDRHTADQAVEHSRSHLEKSRFEGQELRIRSQTLGEQIIEMGFDAQALFENLMNDAEGEFEGAAAKVSEQLWQERVDQIAQKIQRLGLINLAAIDEFAEQSERKIYLDAQFADLNEALNTLEDAMRKIDRETRARFKQTFDQLNEGLQTMFPRLFGGGHAYLELSGEDLLNTGVTIMARPPGKGNRTIHALSGGEKALTAVAMVFAIFELNPAPFCMLDEVDASLDEANVGRFCELVQAMSSRIQFIYITHNKSTMEVAHQLTGVTMYEPGVSRLVAVDIDEAAALIAV
jgi:chromosome segregation protein